MPASPPRDHAQRTVSLAANARSASQARHFVRRVLHEWACDQVAESAELVTGELAGNAVLHTGSPFQVTLSLEPAVVRVAVDDVSPVLPTPRHYGQTAITGRGLAVIAASALRWGVNPRPPGKQVWAELSRDGAAPAEPQEPEIVDAPVLPPDRGVGQWSVDFVGVPVTHYLQLQRHNDELLRDFALLGPLSNGGTNASFVPARVLELMAVARGMFVRQRDALREQVEAAIQRGDTRVDLHGWYGQSGIDSSQHFLAVLEEADEFCRAGHLIGSPAPSHVASLRRWFVDQMIAQAIDGQAPQPPPAAPDVRE
jgi:hypothetical protein